MTATHSSIRRDLPATAIDRKRVKDFPDVRRLGKQPGGNGRFGDFLGADRDRLDIDVETLFEPWRRLQVKQARLVTTRFQ